MSPRIARILILMILALGAGALAVYAMEADKEVRILCGLFQPGTPKSEMDRILGTAHFLDVVESFEDGRRLRVISSRWNMGRNGCRVGLADGVVVSKQDWEGFGR